MVGFLESNESCPGDKTGSGEEDSFKEHSSPCSEHTEAEVVEHESDEAEGIEQESNDCICWDDCCCIFVDDVGHILLPQQFSQSTINGRNGSNACTIIAALMCRRLLLKSVQLEPPGFYPPDVSVI